MLMGVGYAGYFFAYEMLVQRATRDGKRVQDLPTWQVMSFGAAAGYAMWIPVYPLVRFG
jgi:solute carrier family 25 carnitine/acylcarnitine transporter 20/29